MNDENKTVSVDEKLSKLNKKRNSKARRPVIIAISVVLVIGLLVGGIYAYLDSMLGKINYVTSDDSNDGSVQYVDIDTYSFEDNDGGYTSDFVDPEASGDPLNTSGDTSDETSSGNSTGHPGGKDENGITDWKYDDYIPDKSILDGIFDGVAPEYKAEVTNILLIGCDTNGSISSRSDTMIIMSINNVKKRVVLTSILRDCYVSIPGKKNNRINAAHAGGGPNLLIKTIETNFGVDIDYYVKVSFSAFKGAVDAIGGADITVNEINYNWFSKYKASELGGKSKEEVLSSNIVVHLNGHETLSYARNRSYANGDFTRTLHQRDLLMQMMDNVKDSSLTEAHNLLSTVLPYIETNMPKDVLKAHVWNSVDYLQYDIVSNRIPSNGTYKFETIEKKSVITLNIAENARLLKKAIYD